ncbi:MAG: GumC family protein [Verrucomicrobiota bacterium]
MVRTQDYMRELVMMVFIRKTIILTILILFVIGALLVALFWPPTYASDGTVLVKRTQPLKSPESVEDIPAELTMITESHLHSEVQILNSQTLANRAAKALLENGGIALPESDEGNDRPSDQRRRLASRIRANMTTELLPTSNVIHVRLSWDDPDEAERIHRIYFSEYLNFRSELYNPDEAQDFFKTQLEMFDKALQERESELVRQAEESYLSAPDAQIRSNLLIVENLLKELNTLQNQRNDKKNYIEAIEKSLQSADITFFTAVDDIEIGDFGQRLQSLHMQRQELLATYMPDSSKVSRVEEQIRETYESMKQEVFRYLDAQKAALESISQRIRETRAQITELEDRNIDLYRNLVENKRINREIELLEDSYNTFGKRLEEARITSRTKTDKLFRVSILSYPQAGQSPTFPNKPRVLILGIILGLLAGGTVGFTLEFFDHRFKRPEDVQNYTGLPHIYSIPQH